MHDKNSGFSKRMTAVIFSLIFLIVMFTSTVSAGSKIIPITGMHFTINASLMDNLNALMGKKVLIILDGGKSLTGIVKSVGQHLVHIEKIERKEFFDSLIRIEKIQAIEVQFRKYQR
ncbi:MAG: hypothetical protein QM504_06250 [Pseudomonadota bacterium]